MQYVHDFHTADGSARDLLGGKGAGLAEMTHLGLPVPEGFTVSTSACRRYLAREAAPPGMWEAIMEGIHRLETRTGRHLSGSVGAPLLVSVRSGAKYSMPGMMDTVLNLGMNDSVREALSRWSGSERFSWDAYRRFIQTYGKVVLHIPGQAFEDILTEIRVDRAVSDDSQLSANDLEQVTSAFRAVVAERADDRIPADPEAQLRQAVDAVFDSWNSDRAVAYRRLHQISNDLGTAANVQMMVFGDLGDDSGTGVCFTRDPATGEKIPYGDYLPNAQGEDVVAGIRNTLSLDDLGKRHPAAHAQLVKVMSTLENHYRDMCDIEFTIERDKLWVLQTRIGKRTAQAAIRMATEMVEEGMLDRSEAVLRVDPASLEQLLHPRISPKLDVAPAVVGVGASPGAAKGSVVFDAETAVERTEQGLDVILVRWETTPDDILGMAASKGILTSHGGKTSHAAVVARGMGIPAVTGTAGIDVDEKRRTFVVGGATVDEGDIITIDGASGAVYIGDLPLEEPAETPELHLLLGWADRYRRLGVWANADTGAEATIARERGAEGIGLARTEHMFMGDRIDIVRRVILSEDAQRKAALEELKSLQVTDFVELLEAMDGMVVVVRLLDPPLHEFLPDRWDLEEKRVEALAAGQDVAEIETMMATVAKWEETNPMLGLRGVRLGLIIPDIYRMQAQAALEAVAKRREAGGRPRLEIMVPLVSTTEELHRVRAVVQEEMDMAPGTADGSSEVLIGTMIETPRAALIAADIAQEADFFSFGTNDLTQMTFGLSRDDAEASFLGTYVEEGIIASNPFESIDIAGVGALVEQATEAGKSANPRLQVGICGEHGGDPASIRFFHQAGLDYVSTSPHRVPTARLAAAQAALGESTSDASV